jgi:H+/Cl- antiporter ClcA
MSDPRARIPATLTRPGALRFWLAVVLTGIGAGIGAAALMLLLSAVQHWAWPQPQANLIEAAAMTAPWRRVLILAAAGLLVGIGRILVVHLPSGNSIDITTAIWFSSGRLPALRTLASAVLSVVTVGMGVSLGREGAPKQAGAVTANALADWSGLSDEQRKLLVACGAGAGMAAAYDVPLGGALFAIEVLRGVLALRLVLPALTASLLATVVSWIVLPDSPTYVVPAIPVTASILCWTIVAGPIFGLVSVGFVRVVALADRGKPAGWLRVAAPCVTLGALGVASIWFPQLLGNGKDLAQAIFSDKVAPLLVLALLVLKPLATIACLGSGAPGGLFTPSLTLGALLGSALGYAWNLAWPGTSPALCAVIGAGAILAATTQGPISAVVLMFELTGHDRSFAVPMLVAVALATLIARTIESRSIYDARLTDAELAERQTLREPPSD